MNYEIGYAGGTAPSTVRAATDSLPARAVNAYGPALTMLPVLEGAPNRTVPIPVAVVNFGAFAGPAKSGAAPPAYGQVFPCGWPTSA